MTKGTSLAIWDPKKPDLDTKSSLQALEVEPISKTHCTTPRGGPLEGLFGILTCLNLPDTLKWILWVPHSNLGPLGVNFHHF